MSLLYLWTWWRVSQGYFRQYQSYTLLLFHVSCLDINYFKQLDQVPERCWGQLTDHTQTQPLVWQQWRSLCRTQLCPWCDKHYILLVSQQINWWRLLDICGSKPHQCQHNMKSQLMILLIDSDTCNMMLHVIHHQKPWS